MVNRPDSSACGTMMARRLRGTGTAWHACCTHNGGAVGAMRPTAQGAMMILRLLWRLLLLPFVVERTAHEQKRLKRRRRPRAE